MHRTTFLARAKSRAFTLIELIVVIVIIGVLVALAAVAYQSIIANAKRSAFETAVHQSVKLVGSRSAADQVLISAALVNDVLADTDAGKAGVQTAEKQEYDTVTADDATKTITFTRDGNTKTAVWADSVGAIPTVQGNASATPAGPDLVCTGTYAPSHNFTFDWGNATLAGLKLDCSKVPAAATYLEADHGESLADVTEPGQVSGPGTYWMPWMGAAPSNGQTITLKALSGAVSGPSRVEVAVIALPVSL